MSFINSLSFDPLVSETKENETCRVSKYVYQPKGGFPFMAETTRNHIFSKEISQVIIAAMVLAPNFY